MSVPSLSFYVTVGRGTESFAECEIRKKFSVVDEAAESLVNFSQVRDGKIVFRVPSSTDCYLEKILSLKCVERAFVAITDYENDVGGKRNFLDRLMQTLSVTQNFATAQKVLDQLSLLLRKGKVKHTSLPSKTTNCIDEPMRKVARLDDTVMAESGKQQQHSPCVEEKDISESDNHVDCEKCFKTFRMSVKCSGKSRKWINVKKLSKDVSWRIARACDWIVDLRNPDFEISLHISDQYVTAGIPLTSKPLSRRPFILDPGLRAPVAWIMVQLADIKSGDVILDPMCGKGTLLLEACSHMKDACYIGVDRDSSQVEAAQNNVLGMESHNLISLVHADGLCMPLKPGSVDGVLCDAPFNQKHFISKRPDEFYVSFLEEMYRLLRDGGRFVLLTSQEFSKMIIPLLQATQGDNTSNISEPKSSTEQPVDRSSVKKSAFHFLSKHYMKLGETHGEIIVMIKS